MIELYFFYLYLQPFFIWIFATTYVMTKNNNNNLHYSWDIKEQCYKLK